MTLWTGTCEKVNQILSLTRCTQSFSQTSRWKPAVFRNISNDDIFTDVQLIYVFVIEKNVWWGFCFVRAFLSFHIAHFYVFFIRTELFKRKMCKSRKKHMKRLKWKRTKKGYKVKECPSHSVILLFKVSSCISFLDFCKISNKHLGRCWSECIV